MKHKQWQRRLLCCFLAVAVLLGGLLCCLPVRAGAIVPLSFVQSALASYVTSSGYKLYNDQGTGSDILGSLGELYDDYVTVNNKTIQGSVATLAWLANSPLIYQDNSGQIVISQVAANIMQDFAEWIQTEYSVPVGSDTPTSVVSGGSADWTDGTGVNATLVSASDGPFQDGSYSYYYSSSIGTGAVNGSSVNLFLGLRSSSEAYLTLFTDEGSNNTYLYVASAVSNGAFRVAYYDGSRYRIYNSMQQGFSYDLEFRNSIPISSTDLFNISISTVDPSGVSVSALSPGLASGLAVTLAQAVADVIGQAQDDDAVVIGVGAGVGATAQDIADMVAQGVKAQTLDPSVSIVAEAVIDTPVQPYPDVDGLGLPTLGAALVSRFPFCVPWDFVDTLKILNADPIPPVFDVTLIPASVAARWGVSGDYTLHVDLTDPDYAKLFVALRWGTLVGFCIGLALLTKRLIWTA